MWQVVKLRHHQLTHLHIHIDVSRNVSWKFAKLPRVITLFIFQPIFIRFSQFCSIFFTLSSEIKLNLFRISPFTHSVHSEIICVVVSIDLSMFTSEWTNMYPICPNLWALGLILSAMPQNVYINFCRNHDVLFDLNSFFPTFALQNIQYKATEYINTQARK